MMNLGRWLRFSWEKLYYAATFVGIIFLFVLGMHRDEESYSRIFLEFKTLMQLDYKLNDAVLRSRAAITHDYDQIAHAVSEIKIESKKLEKEKISSEIELRDLMLNLRATILTKIRLVEWYKSTHALLKISTIYLPKAHHYISTHPSCQPLLSLLDPLYKKVMGYYINPDPTEEEPIRQLLKQFTEKALTIDLGSTPAAQEIRSFSQQVETILQYRRTIDLSIASITAVSIADNAQMYQSIYMTQVQAQRIRTTFSKVLLALLSITLLAFLYRKAIHLTQTAQALADINADLDQKVLEKTETIVKQQASLTSSAKLSALGEMASGIAHEINNPLTIILGKARMAKKQVMQQDFDEDLVIKNIDMIESTALRIAKIVKGLRSLSRNADNDPFAEEQVSNIVKDVVELCQDKFKQGKVEIRLKLEEDPYILCRPTEIAQVLVNLLSNAFDAVSSLEDRWVEIGIQLVEGTRVQISVTDSGRGISPEVAARIMLPFFTTKEVGIGTGLGLSISTAIIQRHNGELKYDGESPHTRFTVEIPRHEPRQGRSVA